MDKVAMYKEYIYKTAGAIGGAFLGLPVGAYAGYKVGKGVAHLIPRGKEMKALDKERQQARGQRIQLANKYEDTAEKAFDKKEFQKHLESLPNYNDLTVDEVEGIANQYFNDNYNKNITKTASLKSTLIGMGATAIPIGALTGAGSFGLTKDHRTNKDLAKRQIEGYKKDIEDYTKKLSSKQKLDVKKYLAENDHQGVYSPSNLMENIYGFGCEGEAYYGDTINEALKSHHGVDYKKMKYKDYKGIVEGAHSILGEDGEWYKKDSPTNKFIAQKLKK